MEMKISRRKVGSSSRSMPRKWTLMLLRDMVMAVAFAKKEPVCDKEAMQSASISVHTTKGDDRGYLYRTVCSGSFLLLAF